VPPPPSLGLEWRDAMWAEGIPTTSIPRELATRAAAWAWQQAMTTLAEREQAAADAQLEWCYEWLGGDRDTTGLARELRAAARAARRPKPPSLKEQAHNALDTYIYGEPDPKDKERTYNTIRRALEALPE
jgi:hypothetical protein